MTDDREAEARPGEACADCVETARLAEPPDGWIDTAYLIPTRSEIPGFAKFVWAWYQPYPSGGDVLMSRKFYLHKDCLAVLEKYEEQRAKRREDLPHHLAVRFWTDRR